MVLPIKRARVKKEYERVLKKIYESEKMHTPVCHNWHSYSTLTTMNSGEMAMHNKLFRSSCTPRSLPIKEHRPPTTRQTFHHSPSRNDKKYINYGLHVRTLIVCAFRIMKEAFTRQKSIISFSLDTWRERDKIIETKNKLK